MILYFPLVLLEMLVFLRPQAPQIGSFRAFLLKERFSLILAIS